MLITENDLTMNAVWTPVEKVADTGDLIEHPEQIVKTWVLSNKSLYFQNENGYNKIPAKGYIVLKDSKIKIGDKLDGVFVQKINEINDFDGTIDHLEVYTYVKGTSD